MSGQDQGVTFSSSSAAGTSNSSSEDYPPTKKRALAVRTFEKVDLGEQTNPSTPARGLCIKKSIESLSPV